MTTFKFLLVVGLSLPFVCSGRFHRQQRFDDDSLTQLLADRESRLDSFNLTTNNRWKINLFTLSAQVLSNTQEIVKVSPSKLKPFPMFSIAHNIFANKSLNFRREGYQLMRDLDIEIMPTVVDSVMCLRFIFGDDDLKYDGPHNLLYMAQRIGWCFNLTYIDEYGGAYIKNLNELNRGPRKDTIDHVDNFGKFVNSDSSVLPYVHRIRRILNALIKLLSHLKSDKDFSPGLTEWYGEVGEETFGKWRWLLNYLLICRRSSPLPIAEDDETEIFSLLHEQQYRLAAFNYDTADVETRDTLLAIDKLLDELEFDAGETEKTSTKMPLVALEKSVSQAVKIEMYQLLRDLVMTLGATTPDKLLKLTPQLSYFSHVYNKWRIDDIYRDPRDDQLHSGVYSLLNFVGRTLNFTYVDYNGIKIEPVDGRVRGKYIYASTTPEPTSSRHLRHIMNGLERVYFKIMQDQGLGPLLEVPEDEGEFNCRYHSIREFVEFYVPKEVLLEEEKARSDILYTAKLPSNYNNNLNLIFRVDVISTPLNVQELDDFVLLKEAYPFLVKAPPAIQSKGYNLISNLYGEQCLVMKNVTRVPNIFGIRLKKTETCKVNPQCPEKFLRLIQIIGKQFDLKYINEYGDEAFIDDTLIGRFVYVPFFEDEAPHTRRVRHLLNEMMDLLIEYYKK